MEFAPGRAIADMAIQWSTAPSIFRTTTYVVLAVFGLFCLVYALRLAARRAVEAAATIDQSVSAPPNTHSVPVDQYHTRVRPGSIDPGMACAFSLMYPPLGFAYLGNWLGTLLITVVDMVPYLILWFEFQDKIDEISFALLVGRVPPQLWDGEMAHATILAACIALGLRLATAIAARAEGEEMATKSEDRLMDRIAIVLHQNER